MTTLLRLFGGKWLVGKKQKTVKKVNSKAMAQTDSMSSGLQQIDIYLQVVVSITLKGGYARRG